MLIREFVQNPTFDVNCYIKIFDSTKEAGWEGKIPVYDGYGSPVDTSEDILSMELSYVTTNQHEIILEGIHRDGVVQKEEPEKLMEGLYDAAYQVNQITDEDDYEQFPDLLDESANITNEFKNLGIVGDGIVSL